MTNDPPPVTGRFAPSPSGRMHLGNLWSCLLAWLAARSTGGRMVLRLEDLDPDRCRPEYGEQILRDLTWMGLDWDGEPVRQSQRREFYAEVFQTLKQKDLLYPCFCTRAQRLAASAPHRSDGLSVYSGRCRHLTEEERSRLARTRPPAWRVRVPDRTVSFQDRIQGTCRENLARDCGDFIVRRSDGVYAYQLAVVADDAAMGVTQVVRGSDLLSSTPRQIWLQEQLGYPTPEYAHVPLLLAPDGRRLAKRDRDQELGQLQQRYTPAQLTGHLAVCAGLLDAYEPLMPRDLLPRFSWDSIPRADLVLSL